MEHHSRQNLEVLVVVFSFVVAILFSSASTTKFKSFQLSRASSVEVEHLLEMRNACSSNLARLRPVFFCKLDFFLLFRSIVFVFRRLSSRGPILFLKDQLSLKILVPFLNPHRQG